MDYDHNRFCLKCGWHDEDRGCAIPPWGTIWQCSMYRYYHPEEVEKFEHYMEEWAKQREGR